MSEPTTVPEGVARTALGVARVRALESRRPDRLFDDPHAQAFVDAAPGLVPDPSGTDDDAARLIRWVAFFTVVRTRFYDDYLRRAVTDTPVRQVVLVAAGLDARAYRLDWPPGVRLFELDLPPVLAFKQQVLDARGGVPRCERTPVGTDLAGDWPAALVAAGFRADRPTAWLVEGLLIYLDAAQAGVLLDRAGSLSAPGSRLSCELQVPRDGDATRPAVPGYTDLWQGGLGARLPAHLAATGWQVAVHDRAEVAAGYGRPGPPSGGAGFVVAERLP